MTADARFLKTYCPKCDRFFWTSSACPFHNKESRKARVLQVILIAGTIVAFIGMIYKIWKGIPWPL